MRLEILPVTGIGDVRPGDDLAALITTAAPWLADGDVLIVTSKIVSKAEGRLVPVPVAGPEREAAREAVLARESVRIVARRGPVQIAQTHHGFVMAGAGIDASNVDRGHLVLLPRDPDASARALRAALRDRFGRDVAVLVSDTMGRPWRVGQIDAALGVAGLDPVRDYRGSTDAYGNELSVTQIAVADELCAAAELVAPVDAAAVSRALDLVASPFLTLLDAGTRDKVRDELAGPAGGELVLVAAEPIPHAAFRAGADVLRLRAALAAEGLVTAWRDAEPDRLPALVPLPTGAVPLGLLAVGLPG